MDADPLHYCGCLYDEEEFSMRMKGKALKLLAMSKKIKKVSMLCIVGMHDWVPT